MQELREVPARLAIVALNLPDIDGIDLIEMIATERLVWRVLVILDRTDEHTLTRLRHAQIDGIFSSQLEPLARLEEAIVVLASGGRVVCHATPPMTSKESRPRLDQLMTPHELLVLAVIGDGCDDSAAAARLGVAVETVHWHRQRIMRKLGVQSRGDLVRAALCRGVVRIEQGVVLRPGFDRLLAARTAPRPPKVQAI
jgi:two-component system nitrate/nitrite response regulator NarL